MTKDKSYEKVPDNKRKRIMDEITGSKFVIKKQVIVSENHGQYVIRVPKAISEYWDIQKGSKVEFVLERGKKKKKIKKVKLEVVK